MQFNQTTLESYNKNLTIGQGTLIGNWQEERDLRDATGVGRTAHTFVKPSNKIVTQPETLTGFREASEREQINDTNERCMGKKYNHIPKTVNSEYGQGKNKADELPKVGPQFMRTQEQMLQHIYGELNEQEKQKENQRNTRNFQTTTQTEFGHKEHAMAGCTVGRRVMRTQNGLPISPECRDEDLLVDNGYLVRQPYMSDNELKDQLPIGESYLTQQPITVWQEKQTDGFGCVYKSNNNPVDPKSSFRLNNQFVKTFHDYSHIKK